MRPSRVLRFCRVSQPAHRMVLLSPCSGFRNPWRSRFATHTALGLFRAEANPRQASFSVLRDQPAFVGLKNQSQSGQYMTWSLTASTGRFISVVLWELRGYDAELSVQRRILIRRRRYAMSTFVHYVREQRLLDLTQLNERDFILISSMYGQIHRGDRILLCEQTLSGDGEGSEMYVRKRNGRYFAAHFPGSTCTQEHEIAQESDEHRRQKDYWQRAAEYAGYQATQELRTGNGTILDVAIDGPRRTGIEVQHSALPTNVAKSRSTRSFRAGWLPVWFLDSDHTPPWFHKVPAVNCNVRLPWSESLPPRRSATALGPSKFVALPCTAGNFGTCPSSTPKRPKRPCSRYHPHRQPWFGLTVDDIATMIPGEELLPMRDLKGDVHHVPADVAYDLARKPTASPGSGMCLVTVNRC